MYTCKYLYLYIRHPIKSTLAHDAVATVVLHKHHLIIRVGAGSSSLSMVHTRAWPRISPSTKIYFRCHFREVFPDNSMMIVTLTIL